MPTTALLEHLPRLSYQVFFDEHTSDAVNELKKDIRRTLRGTLRTVDSPPPEAFLMQTDSFLAGWSDVKEAIMFLFSVFNIKMTSCSRCGIDRSHPVFLSWRGRLLG